MLSREELVGLALGFLSALSRPQQEGSCAGWVSGTDSISLNCLGIKSSPAGDSAEPYEHVTTQNAVMGGMLCTFESTFRVA